MARPAGDCRPIKIACLVDDHGVSFDRGSIDHKTTREAVVNILEGGEHAFRRRMELYQH